jgi:hypothetical protein
MKMCMPHWNALREEIENRRGLEQFVSHSGKEVVSRMVAQLEDSATIGDPLMEAHNRITGNAMERYGLALLGASESGEEYCPLCLVDTPCGTPECVNCGPGQAAKWIEYAGRDTAEAWAKRMEASVQ